MLLELVAFTVAALSLALAAASWLLARRWAKDCAECHIIIARKGKVALNAPLTEWLAWNRALPKRDQTRGGIIFHANGIQVALARPKIGAAATTAETKTKKDGPGEKDTKAAA